MAQPVTLRSSAPAPVAPTPVADPAASPTEAPRKGFFNHVPMGLREFFSIPTFLTGTEPPPPANVPVPTSKPVLPPVPTQPLPLKRGDTGPRVVELQKLLKEAGYFYEEANGNFGRSTERAVVDFQSAYVGGDGAQVGVDGVAGQTTINALRALKRARTQTPAEGAPEPEKVSPSFYQVGQVQTLVLGSHGPEVQRAQLLLKALGYVIPQEGVFDQAMLDAVTDFQQRYIRVTGRWVETDGKIGPTTGFAMASAVESMRESPVTWIEFAHRLESQTAQPPPPGPITTQPPPDGTQPTPSNPPPLPPLPPPNGPAIPNYGKPVLKAGATDTAQVTEVQNQLIALGYGLTADGNFGRGTEAALTDFQRLYALFTGQPLVADGTCGDSTRKGLVDAMNSGLMNRLPEPLRHGTISVGYLRGVAHSVVTRQLGDGEGGALETRAALAYYAMHATGAQAGATFSAGESFRTMQQQTYLWNKYHRSEPGRAARPGWSTHQSGIAIDAQGDNTTSSTWLTRHAKEYGFILPGYVYSSGGRARVETWHWEYRVDRLTNKARAFYGLQTLSEDPAPTATPPGRRRKRKQTTRK